MNKSLKIALYILLVTITSISGFFALKSFGQLMNRDRPLDVELEDSEPVASETIAATELETNATPEETNTAVLTVTNTPSGTNLATLETGSSLTNIPPGTNEAEVSKLEPASKTSAPETNRSEAPGAQSRPRVGLWTGVFLVSLIGLGLLIASDVSQFFGTRAVKFLYNEEGEGVKNPEYEAAEQVWANGDHLEAIRLMREYLARNPREQYVAIRIAEIYEKDLGNHLAAALEYEEVLKHKLPPDRWGWAAIHLCNLYFKLNHEQKAHALLRRIVNEYGQTPAAEKARKRLEQVDGPLEEISEAPAEPEKTDGPKLPPGFRPKR